MNMTIVLTFGRNIGLTPMPDDRWRAFIQAAAAALTESAPGAFIETHHGRGVWKGVAEDSAKVAAIGGLADLTALAARLEDLAAEFEQDAIALTVGTTQLIAPAATARTLAA
jgi:hypothetical protein